MKTPAFGGEITEMAGKMQPDHSNMPGDLFSITPLLQYSDTARLLFVP